ncbi:MAG: zinc-ribbon domain-containing protein [Deltaproteobacteria bacterium]|nr:zinc-ribbon domain-containing protein [Deltaproteobacteria bacterium]
MPVKVECESCKAPYTIDERRIPAAGLRVRCPKCTKTFVVKKPGDAPASTRDAAPDSASTAVGTPGVGGGESLAALPAKPPPGVPVTASPPDAFGEIDLPAPVSPSDAGLPAPKAPAKKPVIKGTALGLGGLVPGVVAAAGVQARPQDGAALPAVPARRAPEADLPAMPARRAPEPGGTLSDRRGFDVDLPAARAEADLPAARGVEADLPAARAAAASTHGGFGEIDLPAVGRAAPRAAAKPSFEIDLPSPAAPKVPTKTQQGFDDLPAPAADLPAARPRAPGKTTKAEFGEIDLPAVGGRADLPAVGGRADLPAVGGRADLPAIGGRADLPAIGGRADLPAPGGQRDLPATRAASTQNLGEMEFGAHLPAVAATAANLPAVGRLAPREPSVAIPSPDVFGGGRDFAVAQTAIGPGYQPPAPPSDLGGFGELELPGPGAPAPHAPDPWGPPPGDFGLRSGTARGFGEVDLGADVGTSPRAATGVDASGVNAPSLAPPMGMPVAPSGGGGSSDFGELELPGPGMGALGASPTAETFSAGPGGLSLDSYAPPGAPGEAAYGTEASTIGSAGQIDSRATGGVGFGEVDLGGGSADDALEFGAIPEEKRGSEAGETGTGYEAPLPKPRTEKVEAPAEEEQPKKPSIAGRVALGVFALAVVGGALLQFDERLGAYGWKAISDRTNADKHASLLNGAVKRTRDGFGDDTVTRANDAVGELQKDIAVAPRYAPLLAYQAYAQFAHEIRFGRDPQRDSLARSALAKVKADAANRKLAEAARDVVGGQLPVARNALRAVLAGDPKDVDAAVTLGELELLAKQPKDAVAAFEQAVKAKDDARTRGGLMRAHDAAGDADKARAEATTVATKYPNHVPSRLLLARYAWRRDGDEKEAMKWLTELEKPSVGAAASASELVEAMTLRGMIHLDRGRMTNAKKAFDEAITAAKGAPTPAPRLGLGEVYLANGQFPQAITEFNLASQAMPDAALPKIGIARALLKQENATQAKATLAPLKDPTLAAEIGYWLGQAEEKVSPERPTEAIKIYEGAITAQPNEVKPYIALANLQAKIGKMEEADATLATAAKNVPPSERLHLGIGELRFRQERYAQALEHFDKALELQPANLEALFSKGRTLLRMGERAKLDDGKKILDQVAAKDEKYPGLALEYGLYYQKTDQIEEALKEYKKALERAPDDIDIQLSVARAQVEAGMREAEAKLREILGSCTRSVAEDVCTTEAKHYLGRALLRRGAAAEAKTYLEAAAAKGDNNAQYHLYHGWVLVELNSLPAAEVEISRALELDKSLGLAFWLRAEIEGKSGKYREAIDSAKRALAITPSLSQAHATIAFSLKQLNQEDGALGEYAQAIKGDPTNPRAAFWRYVVADIHFHRNSVARATTELRDAIKQAKAMEPPPPWLPKANFYLAEALRHSDKAEALKYYREYLNTSVGSTDPARKEAQAAVNDLAGKQ